MPQDPLARMKAIATGLLVVMACVFVAARQGQDVYPWLGYVRAFAEAAMVGGLADWFAVTALFRRPFGLPIPHTAIIPTNKDRIGDALATFLKSNFLTPRLVARRLLRFDMAAAVGRWLAAPREASARRGFGRLVAQAVEALDSEEIGGLIRSAVGSKLRTMEVSPLLGRGLDAAIAGGRHEPVIDAAVQWAARALDANEYLIRDAVRDRTAWLLRLANVDDTIADRIVDAIRKMLDEIAGDPEHPVRRRATKGLEDLAFDMQFLGETREKVERLKRDVIENPAVSDYLGGLWGDMRQGILRAANDPDAALSGRLGEASRKLGETLLADARLRGAVNLYARRAIVGAVANYGDELVKLVSETIRSWDAETVTGKIENAVGRDLQYIRINGTVIGGLVGLSIHAATELL